MASTVDIAVCLDCSLSMSFYLKAIRSSILSILQKVITYDPNDVGMALVLFQSYSDMWFTTTHPFTSSLDTFTQHLNSVRTQGGDSDKDKAIVDALSASLSLNWRRNNNPRRFHENLVILFTDGPPCGLLSDEHPNNRRDLWLVADDFVSRDITLVVVGIEPSVVVCDDFYCALANKTGGEYIPFINAHRVLSSVIPQAINGAYTFSQLFRHLDVRKHLEANALYSYKAVESRARLMIERCDTMAEIREWFYTYRQRRIEYFNVIDISVETFSGPGSWPLSIDYFHRPLYSLMDVMTSTPTTDDEGYHTRLPTTASDYGSLSYATSSFRLVDSDATDGTDDDVFIR